MVPDRTWTETENYLKLGPIEHGYGEIADVISERAFSTIFSPTQTEMIVKPQVMQGDLSPWQSCLDQPFIMSKKNLPCAELTILPG